MFVPFRHEGELLLPDETPEQAFHWHKNEGLLCHLDKLKKMLEATSKEKKIDEARKELEDGNKNDEEDDDGGGLQIKGDLKSDYEHILQLDPYPDPIDLEARVSMLNADQRRVYDKITSHLLHLQKHEKQECACTELKPICEWCAWDWKVFPHSGHQGIRESYLARHRQHHCSGCSHRPGSLQCERDHYVPVVPVACRA